MSYFDITFYTIVGLSALIGLYRGFTKEILSLLAWISAVAASYLLFQPASNIVKKFVHNPMMADTATVVVIFVTFLVLITVLGHLLSLLIKKSFLNGIDRVLGLAYGFLRGFFLIFVMELILSCIWLRPDHPAAIQESRFSAFVYKGSDVMYGMLPESLQHWIQTMQQKRMQHKGANPDIHFDDDLPPVVQSAIDRALDELPSAEELSNLKTKQNISENLPQKPLTQKQEQELDRLINQADIDDE